MPFRIFCSNSSSGIRLSAHLRLKRLSPEMAFIEEIAAKTGRPVDLIDLRTAGEPVLGETLKHGVRILGSTAKYADLIRKHLFDNAFSSVFMALVLVALAGLGWSFDRRGQSLGKVRAHGDGKSFRRSWQDDVQRRSFIRRESES